MKAPPLVQAGREKLIRKMVALTFGDDEISRPPFSFSFTSQKMT
jgi:hypothetical protein